MRCTPMPADQSNDAERSLTVERALARLSGEVFRMETSADIAQVVRVLWEELRALDFEIVRASISIIDEDNDFWGTYQVGSFLHWWQEPAPGFRQLGDDLYVNTAEMAISAGGGPYREPLREAWRKKEVFRYTLSTQEDKSKLVGFATTVQGWKADAESVPSFHCTYVPFRFGLVGVFSTSLDPDQFGEEDIALLSRFGETFAGGYQRFLDLRQREIQRSVDRVHSQVVSMTNSNDIVQVVAELARLTPRYRNGVYLLLHLSCRRRRGHRSDLRGGRFGVP